MKCNDYTPAHKGGKKFLVRIAGRRNSLIASLMMTALFASAFEYSYAQEYKTRFHHISLNEGLSQSTVICILQDRKGFIWFGTQDGLNRYDGHDIKIFKHDPSDSNSLSDNFIVAIWEDSYGYMWIGTMSNGLNRFDPSVNRFEYYQHNPDDAQSISNNRISSIFEDGAGNLWIGTEDGLNRFDRDANCFTCYRHDPSDNTTLSGNRISAICEDQGGNLWVGTRDRGLNKLDRDSGTFYRFACHPGDSTRIGDNTITTLHTDLHGNLWVGTEKGGVYRYDHMRAAFICYKHNHRETNSTGHNRITAITNKNGVLWVATYNGLDRFDHESQGHGYFLQEPNDLYGLNDNTILSLYEDRTGSLWIGTMVGGVNRVDRSTKQFGWLRHDPEDANSLSGNDVRSVCEDNLGRLWVGTFSGLNVVDRINHRITTFQNNANNANSLGNNHVYTVHMDSKGGLWVGFEEGGLDCLDTSTNTFTHYHYDPRDSCSLGDDKVTTIYEDTHGELWIGTSRGGLNIFDPEKKNFKRYQHNPLDPYSLSDDDVRCIIETRAGGLWIGTLGGGLNRFDRGTEQFIRYQKDINEENSLSDNRVFCIFEDHAGIIWIGTQGGGLNRFDPMQNKFSRYTEKDGMPNNVVYGILEDDDGNLWISTNRGLAKFDPYNESFSNYDIDDGLQSNEFNFGAHYKNIKGEMFFGGINGLNVFYPDSIKNDTHVPPIVITDFQILNKSVPVGQSQNGRIILTNSATDTEEIELHYNENVFSFEFAALHYIAPENNRYAYVMEGFEKEWNYVGNRRFATYTNLGVGEFTFRVKGSNCDGVWNEEGVSVKIKVLPPFYLTWWFRTLTMVIIFASIIIAHRVRTDSITRRNKQLAEINQELSRQISERKKAEKALQKAHDELENRVAERTVELKAANRELQTEILERKRVEEALQYTQFSVDHAADSVFWTRRNGKFIYVNEAACHALGYSRSELLTKTITHIDHNCTDEVWRTRWDEMKKRCFYTVESFFCKKDGSIFPVEIVINYLKFGAKEYCCAFIRDITERKKAEKALEESEGRFRSLFENSTMGLYRTDPEGHILMANPKLVEMLGLSSFEELARENVGERSNYPRDKYRAMMRESGLIKGMESTWGRKDGSKIQVRESATAIKDRNGKVLYYEGTVEDVTDRKRAEDKIKRSLKEKEVLLKEIHHRVKNNMQVISSMLRLQSAYIHDAGALEMFKESQNRVKSMALIHEKLYQSDDLARVDFGEYIKNLTSHLLRSYRSNASSVNIETDVEVAKLDVSTAIPCGLIVNELVSNSLKHAFPNGKSGKISLQLTAEHGSSKLVVSDDGVGFPSDVDFRNTESLGLQLVNTLTNQLQGSISLSSDNRGTKFEITFKNGVAAL